MPCQYHSPEEEKELAEKRFTSVSNTFRARLDEMARFLCEAMTIIESSPATSMSREPSKELHDWWEKHKKEDEERRIKELQASNAKDPSSDEYKRKKATLMKRDAEARQYFMALDSIESDIASLPNGEVKDFLVEVTLPNLTRFKPRSVVTFEEWSSGESKG